jgi:hypothetical protein
MAEEVHEIERLIKQSGELADSLLRLARKLRGQGWRAEEPTQAQSEQLAALVKTLIELASRSGEVMHEIDDDRSRRQDKAYVTVRRMVESGTITAQEAAVTLLQAEVVNRNMTPAAATEQLAKLLRPELPVSKKIEIRESARAAFDTGDDVLEKIKPFLKGAAQNGQPQEQQQIKKKVAVTP